MPELSVDPTASYRELDVQCTPSFASEEDALARGADLATVNNNPVVPDFDSPKPQRSGTADVPGRLR
jgi:hypothetical protein